MIDLLLATDNPGKLAELRALLPDDVHVVGLRDVGLDPPEETGSTIAENAALKAMQAARSSGRARRTPSRSRASRSSPSPSRTLCRSGSRSAARRTRSPAPPTSRCR